MERVIEWRREMKTGQVRDGLGEELPEHERGLEM